MIITLGTKQVPFKGVDDKRKNRFRISGYKIRCFTALPTIVSRPHRQMSCELKFSQRLGAYFVAKITGVMWKPCRGTSRKSSLHS